MTVIATPQLAPWMSIALLAISVAAFGLLLMVGNFPLSTRARVIVGLAVVVLALAASPVFADVVVPCTDWGCIIDSIFW